MKTLTRTAAFAAVLLAVAGCSTTPHTPLASRATPIGPVEPAVTDSTPVAQGFRISSLEIVVPQSLRVSEANSYYPNADIVWRGDLPGDRHEQVRAIFETAFDRGSAKLSGGTPVDVEVEVLRFHSLTEKTRYSFGGVHSIKFRLTLLDPQTGAEIASDVINADLKAYGGSQAIAMEAKGWGQKARITQHLANVVIREMSGEPARG